MTFVVAGALLIGLTLGMLGSGGSAITVPILIYVVGHEAKVSIAESMAIVGFISIVAALPYAAAKQVHWQSVMYFGLPGVFGTYLGAVGGSLAPDTAQLVMFAAVLLLSAGLTLLPRKATTAPLPAVASHPPPPRPSPGILAIEGLLVGAVTGFVGVGGGFLIVPALVFMGKLPLRSAIGTSLVIIALNAAVGFVKYQHFLLTNNMSVDAGTILMFSGIGIAASFLGRAITARLEQATLKAVFACVLITLGGFVVYRETTRLLAPPPATTTTQRCREEPPNYQLAMQAEQEMRWKQH